ncbi:MAG: M28 family peptidase [Pseudomonadota bacterium]
MNKPLLALTALALALPTAVQSQNAPPPSDVALEFARDLTTEIGPRQAGTEAEARARIWALARLQSMGFANVRVEEYQMPTWVRGEERASIISPHPQALAITALGNSGATPASGMDGDVVGFRSLAEFEAAPDSAIRGKIVYIGHAMRRTQDGSSYGAFGPVRFSGPGRAAARGAAAIIIRSVGTDSHRNPHTGNTNFPAGVTPIPSGAISNPDADQIERMMARGAPIRLHLLLTPRNLGMQTSGNVIAEVPGADPSAGIALVACHLDSWDLGTGAIDDAAGCAVIVAAAQRVAASGQPRRTIRILLAGAEEVGVWGGRDYGARHATDNHAVAMEADFGAGRVWRVDFRLPEGAAGAANRITASLAPFSVSRGRDAATGGADVGVLAAAGLPLVDLQQDGTKYFDLHHTPDDTFDKIVPEELAQIVSAWTSTLWELANAPERLGEAE